MKLLPCFLGMASAGHLLFEQLQDSIDNLNTPCTSNEIDHLLSESMHHLYHQGFASILFICHQNIEATTKSFQKVHADLWRCSDNRCNRMLYSLYGDDRCHSLRLFDLFARQFEEYVGNIIPFQTSFLPRLRMLKSECRKAVSLKALEKIYRATGPQLMLERSFFSSWLSYWKRLHPVWPYEDLSLMKEQGIVHMATLSAHISNRGNIFITTMASPSTASMGRIQMSFNDIAAIMVSENHSGQDIKQFLMKFSDKTTSKIQRSHIVKQTSNFAGYRMERKKLKVTTSNNMGVYILKLTGDSYRDEAQTICDSLWSDAQCDGLSVRLPTNKETKLIVLMGPKSLIKIVKKVDNIRAVLQMGDVETFDEIIRQWLISLNLGKEEKFDLMASWIFLH